MINLTNAVNIKGYMMENELEWLARTARDSKCIVEIGTYYGRSARAMADNTKGRIYCIDPYPGVVFYQNGVGAISSGNYVYKQAQKLLADHIDSGKLVIHRGTVTDFPFDIEPDFIFIDGDHVPEAFKIDLEWGEKKIAFGGILSGHDYDNVGWPAVKELVDARFPTIGREGYIWWTRR